MDRFKPSKFNHIVENEKGDVIVYNYLYKQLCKFDCVQYPKIGLAISCIKSTFDSISSSVLLSVS